MQEERVVIMGAAGRDFHNFNVVYRDDPEVKVVAFTATQIPNISGRRYPASLAGPLYPKGIPIVPEEDLPDMIRRKEIDTVMLAYSDLPHTTVMNKASLVLAMGANFILAGPHDTMIPSGKPVISVCAVRTGAGKSPLTQYISKYLKSKGLRTAVIRHPMPYGDLEAQAVQRFASFSDLDAAKCTIEEREEYEPHIRNGAVVFAGVDYGKILEAAEKESDLILWDGGNNDFSFYVPDLSITVADPHRAGHELSYYPGETNFRMADVIVVSKTDSAKPDDIRTVEDNARKVNPKATVVRGALKVTADNPGRLRGHRTLVIEDGPTMTHGGLTSGAGSLLAAANGAKVVDAQKSAVGSLAAVYGQYPHLRTVLPAMGYSPQQIRELEESINKSDAEFVVDGSPVDLSHVMRVRQPVVNASYEYVDLQGRMTKILDDFLGREKLLPRAR